MSVPVVVVGAGPVGLALALELGWRSIPVLVLDESDGSVTFPAGEAIFSRTMEHFRRWGIADHARRSADPGPEYPHRIVFMTTASGHLLADFDNGATNTNPGDYSRYTPEGPAFFSKFSLVPTLRNAALAQGAKICYGKRVSAVHQDLHGATVRAEDVASGETTSIKAQYVVSCEGGRSSLRRSLGIELTGDFAMGRNFAAHFKAPELMDVLRHRVGGEVAQVHTLASKERPYITVVNGVDEWRISTYIEGRDLTEPEVVDVVRRAVGFDIGVQVLKAQPWSGHRVVAERYRDRRVFLAGDAAHLLWPKGGFGANTGIGDAVDLGWKLAATIRGWGGEMLLDSYEAERRPIAVRNVLAAQSNWSADMELDQYASDRTLHGNGPVSQTLRNEAAKRVQELRRAEFETMGVQLGYHYGDSPVCFPSSLHPLDSPAAYQPSTIPGARAPHCWLPDGTSTLDHFGDGFTLLIHSEFIEREQESVLSMLRYAADRSGVPITELRAARGKLAPAYDHALTLVRPDGHVCWRSNEPPKSPQSIINRISGRGLSTPTIDRNQSSESVVSNLS